MPESETQDSEKVRALSQKELEIAFSGPAVLTNRFYVTIGAYGIRISFTEVQNNDADPVFRTGCVMCIQDGIRLKNLLQEMLKDVEAELQQIESDKVKSDGE